MLGSDFIEMPSSVYKHTNQPKKLKPSYDSLLVFAWKGLNVMTHGESEEEDEEKKKKATKTTTETHKDASCFQNH